MANQDQVMEAFIKGKGPKVASNFFWEHTQGERVLYSYGHHFPLVVKVGDLFIVNGDRDSNSTSHHQAIVQSCLRELNAVTTSFAALQRATNAGRGGYFAESLIDGTLRLVDYSEELNVNFDVAIPLGKIDIPDGATPYIYQNKETEEKFLSGYHRAARSLFFDGKRSYICGMDERSYFVSVLPRRARSVKHAFEMLKPVKIKRAERMGTVVKRQGEWFCLPHTDGKEAKAMYKAMKADFVLPGEGNAHIATRGMIKNKQILFSGGLRHVDHKTLRVSTAKSPEVWEAVRNTAIESFSAAGVD